MFMYESIAMWLNDNQGVVSAVLFVVTLVFGWLSGIFSALRKRPKFQVKLLPGPTFCCTYETGAMHEDFPVHRTAFALYLAVANVGSAASSIESIAVGYHCHLRPFSWQWLRYTVGWFWLRSQAAIIHDFQGEIGKNIKIYPFLFQSSALSGRSANTFLQPGQDTNGVVYFEQNDSWGGFFPSPCGTRVNIKIELLDTFGGRHAARFSIDLVTLEYARKYNASFGKTFSVLRDEILPYDAAAS